MKMNNILEYKGYHTKVEVDCEDFTIRGKIEGIDDLVNFECEDIKDIETEFHAAVDDYLEFCQEVGKTPEKEYKGSFNVRVSPDTHKKLAQFASKNGESLNSCVEKAILAYINADELEEFRLPPKPFKTESIYKDNKIITLNKDIRKYK